VNVLSPGQIDTPDSQRIDKETRQLFESLIPRGKMGRPEEIASAALFLAQTIRASWMGWSCLSTAASRQSESADLGECIIAEAFTDGG
jgi:NAD(P)-dependent dehydrogenase (short-subunit alcohol dehydrogenase family)